MRVKRGKSHLKRRKNLLKRTKGFRWGRKKKIKLAKTAVLKAGAHAYRDRRVKKRTARQLWNIKINAGVRQHELTYSKFIKLLHDAKVDLDRKSLAHLAEHEPKAFQEVVELVKK